MCSGVDESCGVFDSAGGDNTLKEGESEGCDLEVGKALASPNDKPERQDKSHVNDDQCSDSVTQLADTNVEDRVQTASLRLAGSDTSNSADCQVQDTEEAAMDIGAQLPVTSDSSSGADPARQLLVATEADPAQVLTATQDSTGGSPNNLNPALDTELPISQNELDDFFAD